MSHCTTEHILNLGYHRRKTERILGSECSVIASSVCVHLGLLPWCQRVESWRLPSWRSCALKRKEAGRRKNFLRCLSSTFFFVFFMVSGSVFGRLLCVDVLMFTSFHGAFLLLFYLTEMSIQPQPDTVKHFQISDIAIACSVACVCSDLTVRSRLLKDCADQLCGILQHIFNLNLGLERVALLWKTSCVVPVPKTHTQVSRTTSGQ